MSDVPSCASVLTPVETLREAARLMRERAQAANTEKARTPYSDPRCGVTPEHLWPRMVDGYLGGEIGAHCASWHPQVALAVADWLTATAERAAEWKHVVPLEHPEAWAVACAYLGSIPDTPAERRTVR
jgi:hypothetical protein